MNKFLSKRQKTVLVRSLMVAVLPFAMIAPVHAADSNPSVATPLVAPANIPGVAKVPFTGVKTPAFSQPSNMLNLNVTPNQGVIGDPIVVSGKGLPANTALNLTWSTADGTWLTDLQPNTVNYMGIQYTKYSVNIATVTTDASGAFSYATTAPEDFGGVHDIFAVSNNVALAHGGFQQNRTFSISPTSGPIGTPITVTYTGMGASLYTGGAAVHWDNSYAGEMQALWTRGTGKVVIRAAGAPGIHYIELKNAIMYGYLNVIQSPIPYTNGGQMEFTVTKDAGAPAPYITWPADVKPTLNQHTLDGLGLDPNSKAVATLSQTSGPILSKVNLKVSGLSTTGAHQIAWASVVGNRVNCTGTCWAYNAVPVSQATVTDGTINQDVTIPDGLGGWHVIQVKQGDKIEAQVPFYIKESIMPFYDASGKQIGLGLAKADLSTSPEVIARGQAGAPATKFKQGEEFTISIKGVGWTQLDNTLAVTYDNTYIGYGCGFNSNGYMVVHLHATGRVGTHIIDFHPLLYTNQPSFANTPYGMVPVLSSDRDDPGLALGYQVPSIHFAITVTHA
ncbi:MAG: hypothetical protein WCO08_02475 [Actinomycetes bacterium]